MNSSVVLTPRSVLPSSNSTFSGIVSGLPSSDLLDVLQTSNEQRDMILNGFEQRPNHERQIFPMARKLEQSSDMGPLAKTNSTGGRNKDQWTMIRTEASIE